MSVRSAAALAGAIAVAIFAFAVTRPSTSIAAASGIGEPSALPHDPQTLKRAVFAGGCFWCVEEAFEALPGVESVVSGYTGGTVANPTYEQVSAGGTGHTEAVEVRYNPTKVSYADLLDIFWHNVDPLVADAQFCDHGSQYRSEIFPGDATERALALASRAAVGATLDKPIATLVTDATTFYAAEEYHQDYYKKNPIRYKFYKTSCGRSSRLHDVWGDAAGVGTLGLIKGEQP